MSYKNVSGNKTMAIRPVRMCHFGGKKKKHRVLADHRPKYSNKEITY